VTKTEKKKKGKKHVTVSNQNQKTEQPKKRSPEKYFSGPERGGGKDPRVHYEEKGLVGGKTRRVIGRCHWKASL